MTVDDRIRLLRDGDNIGNRAAAGAVENEPVRWSQMTDNNQDSVDANQRDQDVPAVRQISVVELKDLMASDTPYELVDVRTDLEQSIAAIDGFRLLDQTYHDRLIACGPDTPLILQCHHGIRSQQAAEYFRQKGFR